MIFKRLWYGLPRFIKKCKIITIWQVLLYINGFASDLLVAFLIIRGIINFNTNNVMLYVCAVISFVLWLLKFFKYIKFPFHYWNVNKVSSMILNCLASYGFMYDYFNNNFIVGSIVFLYVLNYAFGKFFAYRLERENFSIKKRETLFHELGHLYICKHYNILEPKYIDMHTIDERMGCLVSDGNIEDVPPFQLVTMLLSGYVTEKYLVHHKKDFSLRELRNRLLVEYEDKTFSKEYKHSLIDIYLDSDMINKAVSDIIAIISCYESDLLDIAHQNRYKKIIHVKDCFV